MRIISILLSLFIVVATSKAGLAHAHLDHANPAVGATVAPAPHEVALWFTQNLEPAFSTVQVTDTSGAEVSQGDPQISGNTMRIELKSLGPGSYTVHWHAVSVDTHKTEGSFDFSVGP